MGDVGLDPDDHGGVGTATRGAGGGGANEAGAKA